MRKTITLLFALLMSSVAVADSYLYIDNVEVYPDQWGTIMRVPVKAHFDARVGSFYAYFNISPELTLDRVEYGKDLTVEYYDETGTQQTMTADVNLDDTFTNIDVGFVTDGYWDPDGTGNYQRYGTIKWEAGDYDEMFVLYLKLADEFYGADIYVATEPYATYDTRGGTVRENGENGHYFTHDTYFTLPKTPEPVVTFTEDVDTLTVTVTGEGHLYINGWDVVDTIYSYKVEREYEPQLIEVWAYAQADGKEPSDEIYKSYEFAAKERPKAETPTLQWHYTDTTMIFTCHGIGGGYLLANGQPMSNPFTVPRTDHDSVLTVGAYAQWGYMLPSDTVYHEVIVPAREASITENPTFNFYIHPDRYTITAIGKGEVRLYVNGQEVENGYDYMRPGQREDDVVIHVAATAHEEGKYISDMVYSWTWVSHQELCYDFIEDSVYYLITGDHKVSVSTHDHYGTYYSGKVVIPNTVTHDGVTYMVNAIADGAFASCTEVTEVTLGENITSIGESAFFYCRNLTEITLGDFVVEIGKNAFYNCQSLRRVTLGSGVNSIGSEAFRYCNALTDIISKPAAPPVIAEDVCFSKYDQTVIHVHPSVLARYQAANYWKDFSSIVDDYPGRPATGDVDGDGNIGINDVTTLIDMILGN